MDAEDKLTNLIAELQKLLEANLDLIPAADAKLRSLRSALSGRRRRARYVGSALGWQDVSLRRGRNPAQFICDEYAADLAAGTLTRRRLKELDRALYDAYANWITRSRHPEDDLGLPKVARTRLDDLADPIEHIRKQRRDSARKWRARQRS